MKIGSNWSRTWVIIAGPVFFTISIQQPDVPMAVVMSTGGVTEGRRG